MGQVSRAAWCIAGLALSLCGCSAPPTASNDGIAPIVRQQATPLRTIEPGDHDFSDLARFGEAVGDQRIVILGEPTHGDGDVYKLKTRLVEYLHEVKGFDVLVIESGLFDLARMRERHQRDGTPYAALAPGRVFFMYSRSDYGRRMLDYVDATQKSARPLQLAAFDIAMGGDASQHELLPALAKFLSARGSALPASADWAGFSAVAQRVTALDTTRPPPEPQAAFQRVVDRLQGELCAPQSDNAELMQSAGFWCRIVASLHAGRERLWGTTDLRDIAGGENADWLLRHVFPGKKVIFWMHTYHGQQGFVDPRAGPGWMNAGTRLAQLQPGQVFMAHITAGRGRVDDYLGPQAAMSLPTLDASMLEFHLAALGAPLMLLPPTDADARARLGRLSVFEPVFQATIAPNHLGSGYQALFFLPQTRPVLPQESRYPLLP
jgi:erythromycin esterase